MSSLSSEDSMLSGLRVLDLADEKGTFCARLLADMGADVIKVERPEGDPTRSVGPFAGDVTDPERSLYFWYHNAGKRGIALDLESQRGQEIFRRLAGAADVVVETSPPGHLRKLGLDYEALSSLNPGLIMTSITGFGQSGLYSDYKSCDIVASALGGQMYVCGEVDTPPLKPYGEQASLVASLFGAVGTLLALRHRRLSGRGQHVDISMQECVAAVIEHVNVRYHYEKVVPRRQGSLHWSNAFRLFPCEDDYVLLSLFQEWETLVEWLDSEGMAADLKDEKWHSEEARLGGVEHIIEVLGRWARTHAAAELVEQGQLMRFPWATVDSIDKLVQNPQLAERDFFTEIAHPELGRRFKYPGVACKLSASPWRISRRAPLIGEHNEEVLAENRVAVEVGRDADVDAPGMKTRVLDFSWVLAGPYATRILADFGAEVIKVQSRITTRGEDLNLGGYFNTWNRNKRGIALDLSKPQGIEIAKRLVEISDVVVENFTPRVMQNWGLDYDALTKIRPDLVMLSMSGMGQTGPWSNRAAFGVTVQAFSGLTYLIGFRGRPPSGIGYSYADHVAGLTAALAVLGALEYRQRTGRGQHIDLSELEAMSALLGPAILDYTVNGRVAAPVGNRPAYRAAAPHGAYRCKGEDRWCAIAVFTEEEWQAFCQALGRPSWTSEERFATLPKRLENIDELDSLVEEWTSKRPAEEVMALLQGVGVAAGMVQDAAGLWQDPQLRARGFFVELEHPVLGKTIADGSPMKLSRSPARFERAAPLLGQDNEYVYCQLLGMTREEVEWYVRKGILV